MKKTKRYAAVVTTTIFILIFSVSCGNPKQTNCREAFEEYYEKNIEAFISTQPDVSPEIARKRGECMLNKLYYIDSTFVFMSGKELDEFIASNRHLIMECNNIN